MIWNNSSSCNFPYEHKVTQSWCRYEISNLRWLASGFPHSGCFWWIFALGPYLSYHRVCCLIEKSKWYNNYHCFVITSNWNAWLSYLEAACFMMHACAMWPTQFLQYLRLIKLEHLSFICKQWSSLCLVFVLNQDSMLQWGTMDIVICYSIFAAALLSFQ